MKQAFVLLILITLFSFLSAYSISCQIDFKIVCRKFTVDSCKCVPKNTLGEYAFVKECQSPYHPTCSGDSTCINCICS